MSTHNVDQDLLSTMTADEREAYMESLDDPEMQGAIEEVATMSDDEMKEALAGKEDPAKAGEAGVEGGDGAKPEQDAATPGNDAESTAPASSQPEPEPEEQFRPVLRADLPANAAEIKAQMLGKQEAIERAFRDGEIDFEEFRKQDRALSALLEDLRARELQARIYADQEKQTADQEWQFNLRQMMKAAKRDDGVDYNASPKLLKDLDLMLKGLAGDPDNADKDSDFFLGEAHRRVLALNGIAKVAPKADSAAGATRRAPVAAIPKTVGDLPGGGDDADLGGGEFAALDKLTGEAYERALGKLTDEQRRRYLEA